MRYSFRLAELLQHNPDRAKRPGTIKMIVEHTGLDRHQVANLLRNEVKYLPISALSRICDYLVEKGHCRADELPGKLFAVEPEHFWELFARRRRLDLCLGVRLPEADVQEGALVVASDSVLMGELLNGVSTMGGTAAHDGESVMRPAQLRQSLVWSPGQKDQEVVAGRARQVYEDFEDVQGDKALIGIGSIKSNPVVELVLSKAFRGTPFESEDDVPSPDQRTCPFFLRYRPQDPHHASSSAGLQLAKDHQVDRPGIYFETEAGKWTHIGTDQPHDAAMVFYIHRESQGRLEMALGGYSGRATRLLANTLASRAEEFWPPVYNEYGVQVGAFIVQYTCDPKHGNDPDILNTDLVANTKVIPIASEVIRRRLAP